MTIQHPDRPDLRCYADQLLYARNYGAWEVAPGWAETVSSHEMSTMVGECYALLAKSLREEVESREDHRILVDVAFTLPAVVRGAELATEFLEEHGHLPLRVFDPDQSYLHIKAVGCHRPTKRFPDEEPPNGQPPA